MSRFDHSCFIVPKGEERKKKNRPSKFFLACYVKKCWIFYIGIYFFFLRYNGMGTIKPCAFGRCKPKVATQSVVKYISDILLRHRIVLSWFANFSLSFHAQNFFSQLHLLRNFGLTAEISIGKNSKYGKTIQPSMKNLLATWQKHKQEIVYNLCIAHSLAKESWSRELKKDLVCNIVS